MCIFLMTVQFTSNTVLFCQDKFYHEIVFLPFAYDKYRSCLKIYICDMYFIKVVLQNNESMKSQTSIMVYEAPAGR